MTARRRVQPTKTDCFISRRHRKAGTQCSDTFMRMLFRYLRATWQRRNSAVRPVSPTRLSGTQLTADADGLVLTRGEARGRSRTWVSQSSGGCHIRGTISLLPLTVTAVPPRGGAAGDRARCQPRLCSTEKKQGRVTFDLRCHLYIMEASGKNAPLHLTWIHEMRLRVKHIKRREGFPEISLPLLKRLSESCCNQPSD